MTDATGTSPAPSAAANEVPFRFETRLAVVLYGGVSLCIYINGIAQELLHLVRASAPDPANPDQPMFPALTGVEAVYREVACRMGARGALDPKPDSVIRTRVVVDVLAGTSAGGLNGLFLAKALANGGDMESLKRLWIEQGDLALLLNDGPSQAGLPDSAKKSSTESLLNSQRMYLKLFQAMQAMKPKSGDEPKEPMLADELDLFITATDLTGLPLPLRIANGLVYERRHKNVFHFVGATKEATGAEVNDFRSCNDPFLAFAGRCTSSFPLAFEPMRFEDVALLRDKMPAGWAELQPHWDRFFRDYLMGAPSPDALKYERDQFEVRSFGDGGYLDNKPFSHAIDALQWRQADANVRRKLLYVEPSPEHPEEDLGVHPKPNAFENLMAAGSTLPRKETIREDLERVLERNERIEHVLRSTRFVPDDVRSEAEERAKKAAAAANGDAAIRPAGAEERRAPSDPAASPSSSEYRDLWLHDMIGQYGAAYGSYHRIKVAELTSELAEVITRVVGLDEDSDDVLAIRMMMSAWRQEHYDTEQPGERTRSLRAQRGLPADWWSENRLLLDFDLSYRLRRLFFVRAIIQGLTGLEAEALSPHPESPRYSQDRAVEILESAGFGKDDVNACRAGVADLHAELRRVLRELARIHVKLRSVGRKLRSRESSPLAPILAEMKVGFSERHSVLVPTRARDRVKIAREVLGYVSPRVPVSPELSQLRVNRREALRRASELAQQELETAFKAASAAFDAIVPTDKNLGPRPGTPAATVRWIASKCVRFYYDRFEHYDMALFPMAYGADVGELAEVQVVRVSPEDACGLVRERDEATRELRVHKLAGTRLGNFGAFLDATWRRSDILWGRLDAAEILVTQLLPQPETDPERATRDALVRRAQVAILEEDLLPLGEPLGRRVLVEAFLHAPGGHTDPIALTTMLAALEDHVVPGSRIAALLDPTRVMQALMDAYDHDRELPAVTRYRLASRAVAVFGRILDGLEGPSERLTKPLGGWLAMAGRVVWGLVELAVPKSLGSLMFRNWIHLLYALELLLFAGGWVLNSDAARAVGGQLLVLTAGAHVAWATLSRSLRRKTNFWRTAGTTAAVAILALAIVGAALLWKFRMEVLFAPIERFLHTMGF